MNTNIKIELEFGLCNGSMNVDIYETDHLISTVNGSNNTSITVNTSINLPCDLKFVLTNKNNKKDTIVDSTGKIIADKFVILKKLVVGRIPVHTTTLFKVCRLTTDCGKDLYNTFWGFNGIVTIDFNNSNLLLWHMTHNNKFEL